AKLGKQIEALAAEAQANDPDKLKARVAELEEEKGKLVVAAVDIQQKYDRLKASREKKPAKPGPARKVPFLTAKAYTRIDRTLRNIERTRKHVDDVLKVGASALADDTDKALKTLKGELERATKLALDAAQQPTEIVPLADDDVTEGSNDERIEGGGGAPMRMAGEIGSSNGKINTDSKRRILIALAQHGSTMSNRLRVIAGITSKHTFRKYLGNLRSTGLVTQGEPVALTDAGRKTLGTFEKLPTGRALIDWWRRELGDSGHRKIFDALVAKPKYAYPPDELRKAAGIESEHTFRKYMGRMRTLGLAQDFGKMITLAGDFQNV
ncbi:MAG: hypothetical protein ACRECQ_17165, partial [Burkholderiaceae bacterium]